MRRFGSMALAGALLFLAGTTGCGSGSGTLPQTRGAFTGTSRALGGGRAESVANISASGQLESYGIRLTPGALNNLPTSGFSETRLNLPGVAANVPFTHIGVDWNPGGHEPPGIYDTPHFDIHFYTLTEAERAAIGPGDAARAGVMPAADTIPAGYVPTPGVVPGQGSHWIAPSSGEFGGQPFDKTMIFGFVDGKMAFLEPMVTRAFLQSVGDVTLPIPQAQRYTRPGLYPTEYRIKREADGSILILLQGLQQR